MRKGLAFTLISLLPVAALSYCWQQGRGVPRVDWMWQLQADNWGQVADMTCADAAVYAVGVGAERGSSLQPGASEEGASGDGYVMRVDASGTTNWTARITTSGADSAEAVCVAPDGAYVVGGTNGTLPGHADPLSGDGDAFLVKYDRRGALVWSWQCTRPHFDYATDVACDQTGTYVVGFEAAPGDAGTPRVGPTTYLAKHDASGRQVWRRELGAGRVRACCATTSPVPGVYVAYSAPTASAVPGAQAGEAVVVRKYNADGTLAWTSHFRAPQDVLTLAVSCTPKTVYVVASCVDATESPGVLLVAYDESGRDLWARQLGRVWRWEARGAFADAGGVHIVGLLFVDLAPSYYRWDGSDAFVAAYDSSGTRKWLRRFGTRGSDVALSAWVDQARLCVAGEIHAPTDTSHHPPKMFLARLSEPK